MPHLCINSMPFSPSKSATITTGKRAGLVRAHLAGLNSSPGLRTYSTVGSSSWNFFHPVEQVRKWGLEFRPARWGLVTGALAGVIVADFDGEKGIELMHKWGITPHLAPDSAVSMPTFSIPAGMCQP